MTYKRGKNPTMLEHVKNCGIGKFVSGGSWIHPDRVIDSYEIIFVTEGEVYINEGGTDYCVRKGELLLLEPTVRHFGYRHSENVEFFWLHWYGEVDSLSSLKHKKLENTYCVMLYFRQLLTARIVKKGSEYIDYLTRLLLIDIALDKSLAPSANPVTEKAVAWINANYRSAITELQVARYCKYNPDYLNRLFKSVYSKTVKQYINEKRMEYIKELMLCDNLPLKQIAERAGFTEYKYFLKFFKYHERITPTEFLKQHAYLYINTH